MKYLLIVVAVMIVGMSLVAPKNPNIIGAQPYQGVYNGGSAVTR